jgi:enamine deaminase RidA (YjgF/YER057c/UK114 family)
LRGGLPSAKVWPLPEDSAMATPESRLSELGIALPTPAAPVANYVAAVRTGSLLVVSGQLGLGSDGKLGATGKVGVDVAVDEAKAIARLCAINVLAQVKAALGSLDRVARIVRLGGFIACGPDFTQHAAVMNGASDLMVEVFGEGGRHARTTVGVPSLPLGSPVEIEALLEIE